MKTRPILFTGPMVRAILEGRKTQTRRVCKPRHGDKKPCSHYDPVAFESHYEPGAFEGQMLMERHCEHGSESMFCPHGLPGDRLWVRETWQAHLCCGRSEEETHYRADGDSCPIDGTRICRWRPSIFMRPWASRITLEVTGVRVERLHDISVEDVFAEGAADKRNCFPQQIGYIEGLYAKLWDSINAKRGFGWDVNPWVWVVEFKRV